jgi:hypothetical protein
MMKRRTAAIRFLFAVAAVPLKGLRRLLKRWAAAWLWTVLGRLLKRALAFRWRAGRRHGGAVQTV